MTKATRAMMLENNISKKFWREEINTLIYTMDRVMVLVRLLM